MRNASPHLQCVATDSFVFLTDLGGRRVVWAGTSTDEVYQAMDWLLGRQDAIKATLAARHLAPGANPAGMALV